MTLLEEWNASLLSRAREATTSIKVFERLVSVATNSRTRGCKYS